MSDAKLTPALSDLETNQRPEEAGGKEQAASPSSPPTPSNATPIEEMGGPSGPDPTRFGDWERKGRCIDF